MYAGLKSGANALADFRSDTVTRPGPEMRAAMADAEVGDDVYGEDPTIQALEAQAARLAGKEAGLFVPSCTQANLLAMLTHCRRGEEIISGAPYHVIKYEAGGASVLGGCVLTALPVEADGGLSPDAIRETIKPDDAHMPISRLLSIENTTSGRAVPLARMDAAASVARDAGLSVHLDGARLFNAATALNVPAAEVAACADSVSICLSKGLGAPVGAVFCASQTQINDARRLRKMVGGGMRQAGIIAAAGLFALDHHIERLAEDHARASALSKALAEIDGIEVDYAENQTNMLFIRLKDPSRGGAFQAHLQEAGVVIGAPGGWIRLVTHLDINDSGIDRMIAATTDFFS